MTNTRVVQIGLVVLAILAGLFLEHVLLAGFGAWSVTQPLTRPLWNDWTWSSFIGLGISVAAAIYLWVTPKTRDVAIDIVAELRKVSWPSLPERVASAVGVTIGTLM